MEAERWQRIDDLLQGALDCAPDRRGAFLENACGQDAALRSEVESLLEAYSRAGSLTAGPAFEDGLRVLTQDQPEAATDSMLGRRIGPYQIIRLIGSGGMGAVYLAARVDGAFQKEVAVKVIRRGLDTDRIIRRFSSECQMLASLDHPNITRVLDAGTTDDGLPYFVMEKMEGQPIDRFCQAVGLDLNGRLRLFRTVCEAVQCAHRNLIVHCDIKPGNVLVTAEGVPKLLDFGIARLLRPPADDATRDGATAALYLMTPEYASPEQVRGEPVTTVSDVYSLGILLYQLLTGELPNRLLRRTPAEIERSICEQEPARPSLVAPRAIGRCLRGDLDNIVLMAIRKDPRQRYGSVEQVSEDIRRYLEGLPVIARPETRGYRAAKFVRRHKASVAAAILIFFLLAGGITATLWQAAVARHERDAARLEQAKAARINAFLQEMVGYSAVTAGGPNHTSRDATVAEMLDDAAQRVETELADQPQVKAGMLATIGSTYMVQAKLDRAQRFLREAYDLDLKLYGSNSRQTASVMVPLGGLSYLRGDYAGADSWYGKALPIYRAHLKDVDFEIRWMAALSSDAAFAKRALGRPAEAEALWQEALGYAPRIPPKYRGQTIAPRTFLAQLYMDRGDVAKADPLASEAVRELRSWGGDRVSLAQTLIDLGTIRRLQIRYAEAEALIQEGTNLFALAVGNDHPNVAYGLLSLSSLHYYESKFDQAAQEARQALNIVKKLPPGTNYYAAVYNALGRALNGAGRSTEAEPLLREALAIRRKYPRRGDIATALGSLGECLVAQKRYAEAEPLLVESYQILMVQHVPESPVLREARDRLVSVHAALDKSSMPIH